MDDTYMGEIKKWFNEERAGAVVKNLQKRNINAHFVSTQQEARKKILDMIPTGAVVSRGSSITIDKLEIFPKLVKRNKNRIIDPYIKTSEGKPPSSEERWHVQREALLCDVFLTSTNAVTMDGKLVNTDGRGNRVAAMIFGPKKIIMVAGINKIVKDENEARERIHNVAAPMTSMRNYLRFNDQEIGNLPCVKTGQCVDCNNNFRGCNYTLIIEHVMILDKDRIHVVLVGEELGL
ncbi:lactate utilization protein [Thermodesulfobacteriota bacterium]